MALSGLCATWPWPRKFAVFKTNKSQSKHKKAKHPDTNTSASAAAAAAAAPAVTSASTAPVSGSALAPEGSRRQERLHLPITDEARTSLTYSFDPKDSGTLVPGAARSSGPGMVHEVVIPPTPATNDDIDDAIAYVGSQLDEGPAFLATGGTHQQNNNNDAADVVSLSSSPSHSRSPSTSLQGIDAAARREATLASMVGTQVGLGELVERTLHQVQNRLPRRTSIILGMTDGLLEPPTMPSQASAMSDRTRITTRQDNGQEFEEVFLKARCWCGRTPCTCVGPSRGGDAANSVLEGQTLIPGQGVVSGDEESVESVELVARKPLGFQRAMAKAKALFGRRPAPSAGLSGSDGGVDMLGQMKEALTKALVLSAYGQYNRFIPCTSLAETIRYETVGALLAQCKGRKFTRHQRAELAATVCPGPESRAPSYRKILATLILIGKHDALLDFMSHNPPIHDGVAQLVPTRGGKRPGLAMASQPRVPIEFTKSWQTSEVQDFDRVQWQLHPLFFAVRGDKDTPNHEKVHYECPPGTILPFLAELASSRTSTWDSARHAANMSVRGDEEDPDDTNAAAAHSREPGTKVGGGYGVVEIHTLHASQQDMKRYTKDGAQRTVAVKKLKSNSKSEFEKERLMLVKLTPLPTRHLAKLLATFEIPSGPTPRRSPKEYFIMFEAADDNLAAVWRTQPRAGAAHAIMKDAGVARWVAKQCRGLATALHNIHEYRYESTPTANGEKERTHGFHGDIKADNILRYIGWERGSDHARCGIGANHSHKGLEEEDDGPLGVLQITDFGLSSFHHTSTALDIKARILGHPYRPPESQLAVLKTTQSLDIWTLGCLYIEFLTWLVEGPDGLRKFADLRSSPDLVFTGSNSIYFYDLVEEGQSTTISVSKGVVEWARDLCNAKHSSQFVCDFVDLIMTHMLLIEETGIRSTATAGSSRNGSVSSSSTQQPIRRRIMTGDLVDKLTNLVRDDDKYYTAPPTHRPNLDNLHDDSHVIKLHMTFAQLKRKGMDIVEELEEAIAASQHTEVDDDDTSG